MSRIGATLPKSFRSWLRLIVILGCPIAMHAAVDNSDLQKEYGDKVLTLRHAYAGKGLHFDAEGKPVAYPQPGPWTLYGQIRVREISLKSSLIHIRGQRLFLFLDPQTNQLRDLTTVTKKEKARKLFRKKKIEEWAVKEGELDIELECDAIPNEMADVTRAMNRVFLAPSEPLSSSVPDFWKGWFAPKDDAGQSEQEVVHRVGGGVAAPRLTYDPEPEYSEPARVAGYSAELQIKVIVGADGLPRGFRIMKPGGMGLDEQAVKAVETWRFEPARKDGHPVAVLITVMVNFKLY